MKENVMRQIPLDLEDGSQPEIPAAENEDLEGLSTEELEELYKEKVKKDPRFRFLEKTKDERRKILIEGIRTPEKALERLRKIDAEDNHEGDVYFRK